jgi:tetratricopeptide (TPR) repeat protein
MRMRLGYLTTASLLVAAMLGLSSTVACSRVNKIRASYSVKQAHQYYMGQNYEKAGSLYEESISYDPDQPAVYFYLGNCYDNQFKPGVDTPENKAFLQKAIANYQKAADVLSETDPNQLPLKIRAYQYLSAAYGTDKADDPVKQEPAIQQLIRLDPGEVVNYFALAKLYEDAGMYDEAEKILLMARDAKPTETTVYLQLAGFYNRQGRFDKTIAALQERAQKESTNPEAFYTMSTYYWDEAYRDPRLTEAEKKDYVLKGIAATDTALQIRPDYVEALVYKNLLLRLQANLEKDPKVQDKLIKQADELRDKADVLRKQKAAGLGG